MDEFDLQLPPPPRRNGLLLLNVEKRGNDHSPEGTPKRSHKEMPSES